MITIGSLTPAYLHYGDALLLLLLGYSVLLFLNSLLFVRSFTVLEYLKVLAGLFSLIYIGVLIGVTLWLTVLCLVLSVLLFFDCYYRYSGNLI